MKMSIGAVGSKDVAFIIFVGNSTGIKMLPYNQDDPHRRRPDITRALKVLNWRPIVSELRVK